MLKYLLIYSAFWALVSCTDDVKTPKNLKKSGLKSFKLEYAKDSLSVRKAAYLDSFFTDKLKKGYFNGTVLFAEKGKVILNKAYGYANYKTKEELTTESSFQLASVTKPITALAVLRLYDKGLLHLDDNVQKFFSNFPYEGITIRMLLCHRSGLPNYMYFSDLLWKNKRTAIQHEDVLAMLEDNCPNIYYRPNRRYNYSNTGYSLLASIIEQASGMPYEDYIEKQVFKPLGMNHSFVYNEATRPEFRLQGVVGYNPGWREAENTYQNGVVGDKGIYSTVEDLFKLDQAMYSGFLKKSTLNEAFTPHHKDLYLHDNYGLGWRLNVKDSNNVVVYHSGWWKGFKTWFIRVLPNQQTIVVLTNHLRGSWISEKRLRRMLSDFDMEKNKD